MIRLGPLFLLLLTAPGLALGQGTSVPAGEVRDKPVCDGSTVRQLDELLEEVSCLVSFDADCRRYFFRVSSAISASALIASPVLEQLDKKAGRQVKSAARDLERTYTRAGAPDRAKDAARFLSMDEEELNLKKLGANSDVAERRKWVSADVRRRRLLDRLERVATSSSELGKIRGLRTMMGRQGGIQAARGATKLVMWTSGGVAGLFLAVGDVLTQTITPAGNCDDDNVLHSFEGVKYAERIPNPDGQGCIFSFAPGPKVRSFMALSYNKRLQALRSNEHLCAYYSEVIARLTQDRDSLIKVLEETQFVEAPVCDAGGKGVSFKIKERGGVYEYISREDGENNTSRFEVKNDLPGSRDQYKFDLQVEKGQSTLAFVTYQNLIRMDVKLTPQQMVGAVVQNPAQYRAFEHFRRSQYWLPAFSECCKSADAMACFRKLSPRIPAAPVPARQPGLSAPATR